MTLLTTDDLLSNLVLPTDDSPATLWHGDVRDQLARLPAGSVRTCVTSPPYFGLRDYSLPYSVWGGDGSCPDQPHDWESQRYYREGGNSSHSGLAFSQPGPANAARLKATRWREETRCARCGAQQAVLGGERHPNQYVAHLLEVFAAVRRVLADDGTLWIVLGDSYNTRSAIRDDGKRSVVKNYAGTTTLPAWQTYAARGATRYSSDIPELPDKSLMGIPWRVALAMQDDGWLLRNDIIWAKSSCLPESVKDRFTRSHEYLFLFAKRGRYYFDQDAVREPFQTDPKERYPARAKVTGRGQQRSSTVSPGSPQRDRSGGYPPNPLGRNRRTVWNVNTRPSKGIHTAVFPEALVTPCVLAGSAPGDLVLDPFVGSGTTGAVALQHGRRFVGIDLNAEYLAYAQQRLDAVHAGRPNESVSLLPASAPPAGLPPPLILQQLTLPLGDD